MPVPFPNRPPSLATPTTVEPPATAHSTSSIEGMESGSWPPLRDITPPTTAQHLRSQAEFFMTGVLPVPAQSEAACSTCLEPLTDDVVKMVKCGHMFHCTCILPWFQSRNSRRGTCPNCRTELFEPEPLGSPHVPIPPGLFSDYGSVGRGDPVQPPSQSNLPSQRITESTRRLSELRERLRDDQEREAILRERARRPGPVSPRDIFARPGAVVHRTSSQAYASSLHEPFFEDTQLQTTMERVAEVVRRSAASRAALRAMTEHINGSVNSVFADLDGLPRALERPPPGPR